MKRGKVFKRFCCAFLAALTLFPSTGETEQLFGVTEGAQADPVEKAVLTESNLTDNMALYKDQDPTSVITMYLTVSSGNRADSSDHTWTEVNTYSAYDYAAMGVDRYKVEGVLQIDETGEGITEDSFGYGATIPNVTVQVRGQSSSRTKQKNYKVRIKKGMGSFRDQRTLNLNKHYSDPFRFTNKLCYEIVQGIPQLIGGRTQFVHLYVKDLTEGGVPEFVDYGLYTMVEQVNKTFLKNHLLDENGQLYKVTFFEWDKYDAIMMEEDDPEFDRAAFERYMEIKGNEEHGDVRAAVEDINNYLKPIEKTVEEHFAAENLCYWMAVNILLANYDSHARNLFLYSPMNSEKLYVIPWDMDASLRVNYNRIRDYHEGESWERGMSLFLGLNLTNRMLKEKEFRDMLTDAVNDLYNNYMSPEIISEKAYRLSQVTRQYLYDPEGRDYQNAPLQDEEKFDELVKLLGSQITENYEYYLESLKMPWPVYVDVPMLDKDSGTHILSWSASYDVNGESISYRYILAYDYEFKDVISHAEGLVAPTMEIEQLPEGKYYLRVVSTNESGYSMECFDYYSTHVNGKAYGCYCFLVDAEGIAKPFIEAGV